tara:strand:+ start:361 stop:774 length:414 start_codon:yes stop_codon:yes gene_type:complete
MTMFKKFASALGLGVIALIFYLFYGTYNSYYQGVRAAESYRYGMALGESISSYYSSNRKFPSEMEKINNKKTKNNYVGKVILTKNGSVHIQLAGDSAEEGVLIFSPEEKGDAEISFSCHSFGVPTKYIPKDCVKEDG